MVLCDVGEKVSWVGLWFVYTRTGAPFLSKHCKHTTRTRYICKVLDAHTPDERRIYTDPALHEPHSHVIPDNFDSNLQPTPIPSTGSLKSTTPHLYACVDTENESIELEVVVYSLEPGVPDFYFLCVCRKSRGWWWALGLV